MSSWINPDTSEIQVGQTIHSSSAFYQILEFIGEGCFGKVAKCLNLTKMQTVAVKILKHNNKFLKDLEMEIKMLQRIGDLDPTHANVIRFHERFSFRGHICLVFEMLDTDFYNLLQKRGWTPLSLCEIRPIAQQLLIALDALKRLRILHTDIKPDNVMLVSQYDQPLKVKLIDFGEAIPLSSVEVGLFIQPGGFRAPEVTLGLPFNEAIDVWGLGCFLGFLYLADNLFPVDCTYQSMRCLIKVLGQPEDHQLRDGVYTHDFFDEVDTVTGKKWRLKTPHEYATANGVEPKKRQASFDLPSSLDDLVYIHPEGEVAEFEDRKVFVDLLKGLLQMEGDRRLTPRQALQHPFFNLTHLTKYARTSSYMTNAHRMMDICRVKDGTGDDVHISATCKPSLDLGVNVSKQPSVADNQDEEKDSWSENKYSESWSSDEGNNSRPSVVENQFWFKDDDKSSSSSAGAHEENNSQSSEEENDRWSSDEDDDCWSSNEDDDCWSSDEDDDCWSSDEDDDSWSSDESWSSDDDNDSWSSNEDDESFSSNEDDESCSSDEDTDSQSSVEENKIRFKDEDKGSSSSEGKHEDHNSWSSNEEIDSWSSDKDHDSWSPDEDIDPQLNEGDNHAQLKDDNNGTSSSNGMQKSTRISVFRRIYKTFRRITAVFCCCVRPTAED